MVEEAKVGEREIVADGLGFFVAPENRLEKRVREKIFRKKKFFFLGAGHGGSERTACFPI